MARTFNTSPLTGQLDVVATLRDKAIQDSIAQMRSHDALVLAARQAIRNGVPIGDVSEASGLSPKEIERRLHEVDEDVAHLAGLR